MLLEQMVKLSDSGILIEFGNDCQKIYTYFLYLQLKASDKDGDTKLEYKIVRVTNNGKRIFKLNPRDGKLDLIGPVKAGEHYAITVEVIDSGGKSSQGKILKYT